MADGGFDVGGDGALAVVVLVVALAGEDGDEAVLDSALLTVGHVVVHLLEAEGHADGVVGAIPGTACLLHLRVAEVDGRDNGIVFGHIVLEDAAQAMFADGAVLTLAYDTFCRHFSE